MFLTESEIKINREKYLKEITRNREVTLGESEECKKLVTDLCKKYGLVEYTSGNQTGFYIQGHKKIYSECIRIFSYKYCLDEKVVFFYKLRPFPNGSDAPYEYCFSSNVYPNIKDIGLDYIGNQILYPLNEKKLNDLETIIKANIIDMKEKSELLKLRDLNSDF